MKIGVLGAGHLGKIHIRCIKEVPEWQLQGFFDPNDAIAEQVVQEFGLKRFATIADLLAEVDAVDIVTPTIFHHECAVLALKQSKHVFVEKPITTTLEEAKELVELGKEANVKIQVGHVERFNPAFTAASPYFNQPMFIETHRLAEFNPRGTDVSVILDLMIHDIDIVLSVVKSNIKKINASGVAVVSDTPDIANARIEFDNGCVANLTASRISLKSMRKSRFFQRDAYIAVDFLKKRTEIVRLKNIEPGTEVDPLAMTIDLGADKGSKQIYFEAPTVDTINAIKTELELFHKAIVNDINPLVSGHDGMLALQVANQIIEKLTITTLT